MTPAGPSDQELAKIYWRKQAQHLRAQLEEANPTMKSTGATGAKPWQPIQDAAVAGASSRAFLTAFGNTGNETSITPKVSPSEVAAAKGRIIEAMVQAGRDTRYIEDAMQKISPHLDIFALSTDPAVQSVLLQRIMNNNSGQNFGMRDLIDAMKLVEDLRNTSSSRQSPQSDPAAMAGAVVNAVKVGIDAGKSNSSDPVRMMEMIANNQSKAHEQQLAMYERLLEERKEQPGLISHIQEVKELQNVLGIGPKSESVQAKELEIGFQKWQAELTAQSEERKSKNQSELVKTLTGGLSRALENPVVRELGRSVGSKIGVKENPLATAQTKAAQEEVQKLSDPLRTVYGFTCNKCGQPKTFTELQMARIREENAGRWVCDSVGCGEVWTLKDSGPK